jgi:ubiquinone biosynthesis protein
MAWRGVTSGRELGRLHDLASILIRYGFGELVAKLALVPLLQRAGKVLPLGHLEELARLPEPVRVRRAIEEMGPTFVKFGQVLSTRVDLLTPDWITELSRLQSQVPPAAWSDVHEQMTEDLGAPPERIFRDVDPSPVAAASIAQVHRARLPGGTEVALKIRRPGIQQIVDADLRLLQRAAHLVEARMPELRHLQPAAVLQQFKESLTAELDLADECRHAERIAANFRDHPELVVPKVFWEHTSLRMNVQEWIDGLSVAQPAALQAAGLDRKLIAHLGAQIVLKMLFEDGFFHADPHPGNLFVLSNNRIALIDYGMVGRLTDRRREQFMILLDGMVERDAERATDVFLEWARGSTVDEDRLASDVDGLVDRYHGVALARLDLTAMITDATAVLRRHRVVLPADLSLMFKAILTLEGMARGLDPDFDTVSEARPFLRQTLGARYAPATLAHEGTRVATELAAALPRDVRRLVRAARAGRLRLPIDVARSEEMAAAGLERSVNRLVLGLVAAALIVGAALTLPVSLGPPVWGMPLPSALGYVAAVLVLARLVLGPRH